MAARENKDRLYKRYLHRIFPGLGCTEKVGTNQYKKLTNRDRRGGDRKSDTRERRL